MATLSYSPLAVKVPGARDPKLGSIRKPWGFLIHTTGGGITDLAKKQGKTPIEVALKVYINSQNGSNGYMWGGPGYVIDHEGRIYQIAPDEVKTNHAGGPNRGLYLSGEWESKASNSVVSFWKRKWPGKKHPYALFPNTSPNTDFVGVEIIPIGDGFGGEPMAPGLRFNKAQHDAVVLLAKDLGKRFGWPAGWTNTSRLLGHEDVEPILRCDKNGGWDPGWLRAKPYFDFGYVRAQLEK